MTGPLLTVDNRDDRTTIYRLLARLSPANRIAFVASACRQAHFRDQKALVPRLKATTHAHAAHARWDSAADERLTMELFMDILHLFKDFSADFPALLARLERAVSRQTRRPPPG